MVVCKKGGDKVSWNSIKPDGAVIVITWSVPQLDVPLEMELIWAVTWFDHLIIDMLVFSPR